jgi:hypothetical protein
MLEFILSLLFNPAALIGGVVGLLIAVSLHEFFPDFSPALGALLVAVGFLLGLFWGTWRRNGSD